ncbi:MAG: metal ABC transporter permease [Abditibacteriales bacterium]|nr:metal ABC transporter permease [Abditibacteriales bacterium]MDW8365573.1 metal ABC transporter permease [Abditibacteriales bacterium]
MIGIFKEILTQDYHRRALLALILASGICSYLSVWVVLRRSVFLGAALAEIASAGVALGALIEEWMGHHAENPEESHTLIGCALAATLLGILIFSIRPARRRIPEEGTIGSGWVIAGGFGLLFLDLNTQGEAHIRDILKGNLLGVNWHDVQLMVVFFLALAVVHVLFFKEFLFISFDPETAATQGYRVRGWDFLLYFTLGVAIALSIRFVGTLITFSSLVLPGVTALLLTRRLGWAFTLSVALAMVASVVGYSFLERATAATVPVCSTVLLLLALVLRALRR